LSERENDRQLASVIGLAQRQVATIAFAMLVIGADAQGGVKENLLNLNLRHAVLDFIFAAVT
jgi:hypothetical protein